MSKSVKVEILGKKYTVRPEFRIIQAIESELGTNIGVFEMMQHMVNGEFKLTHLAIMLWCMVDDKNISMEEVGEALVGNVTEYLPIVAEFLAACNLGSEELAPSESDGGTEGNE